MSSPPLYSLSTNPEFTKPFPSAPSLSEEPLASALEVFSVIDNGRVHISIENKYMGSIKLHSSHLFGRGKRLLIGNEVYTVKRNSLEKHMLKFAMNPNEICENYRAMIAHAVTTQRVCFSTDRMSEALSDKKKLELIDEFQRAVCRQDFLHAITIVKRGLPMGNFFFSNDLDGKTYLSLKPLMKLTGKRKKGLSINVKRNTPYTYVCWQPANGPIREKERQRLLLLLKNEYQCDHKSAVIILRTADSVYVYDKKVTHHDE